MDNNARGSPMSRVVEFLDFRLDVFAPSSADFDDADRVRLARTIASRLRVIFVGAPFTPPVCEHCGLRLSAYVSGCAFRLDRKIACAGCIWHELSPGSGGGWYNPPPYRFARDDPSPWQENAIRILEDSDVD